MKRLTIVKEDNKVNIDGLVFFNIDCSGLPSNFHALQWYGEQGYGEEEWVGSRNTKIYDIDKYQPYIDAWNVRKQEYDAFWAEQAALAAAAANTSPS